MKVKINSLEDLPSIVVQLLPFIEETKIVLLYGEMGVGKTTFTQELLRQMGVSHPEGSPTYSLINEYQSTSHQTIYHLDLYRLKSKEEAYDIGMEDILDGNSFCFIEWPEKITSFLSGSFLELHFSLNENFEREIELIKKAV